MFKRVNMGFVTIILRFSQESMLISVWIGAMKIEISVFSCIWLATKCSQQCLDSMGIWVVYVFFFFFYCTHRIDSTFEIRLNYTHRTCDIRRCGLCVAGMSECELISYHLDIYVNFEWQMFEMLYGMLSKWLKGETKHFNLFESYERDRKKTT